MKQPACANINASCQPGPTTHTARTHACTATLTTRPLLVGPCSPFKGWPFSTTRLRRRRARPRRHRRNVSTRRGQHSSHTHAHTGTHTRLKRMQYTRQPSARAHTNAPSPPGAATHAARTNACTATLPTEPLLVGPCSPFSRMAALDDAHGYDATAATTRRDVGSTVRTCTRTHAYIHL